MRKGSAILIIGLIIIALIAFITNPNKEHFNAWLVEKIQNQHAEGTASELELQIGDLIAKYLGKNIINNATTHYDYKLFSIYEVNLFDEQMKFLGVFNTFVKITK